MHQTLCKPSNSGIFEVLSPRKANSHSEHLPVSMTKLVALTIWKESTTGLQVSGWVAF